MAFLDQIKVASVKLKDTLLQAYHEKEKVGEEEKAEGENMKQYLDVILKTRAFDLLWLEKKINKGDLLASLPKKEGQSQ